MFKVSKKIAVDVEELIDQHLSCSVCFNPYNWKDHVPVVLACSHCFCSTCVANVMNLSNLCPICRQVFTNRDQTPHRSIVISNLVEWFQSQSQLETSDKSTSNEDLSELLCETYSPKIMLINTTIDLGCLWLDLDSLKWKHFDPGIPRLPEKRECENSVYVLGGLDHLGQTLRSTWILSLSTKEWLQGSDTKQPRRKATCVALNGKIFFLGGSGRRDSMNSCEVLDLKSNNKEWRYISSMKSARYSFSVTTLDNCLYIFGGMFESKSLNSVEKYDACHDTWMQLPPMRCTRVNSVACVFNGMIFVAGGRDRKTVEEFNPLTNQWTFTRSNLTFGRSGGVIASIPENLILVGGDKYDTVEMFNSQTQNWSMWPTWCNFLGVVPSHHVLTLVIE